MKNILSIILMLPSLVYAGFEVDSSVYSSFSGSSIYSIQLDHLNSSFNYVATPVIRKNSIDNLQNYFSSSSAQLGKHGGLDLSFMIPLGHNKLGVQGIKFQYSSYKARNLGYGLGWDIFVPMLKKLKSDTVQYQLIFKNSFHLLKLSVDNKTKGKIDQLIQSIDQGFTVVSYFETITSNSGALGAKVINSSNEESIIVFFSNGEFIIFNNQDKIEKYGKFEAVHFEYKWDNERLVNVKYQDYFSLLFNYSNDFLKTAELIDTESDAKRVFEFAYDDEYLTKVTEKNSTFGDLLRVDYEIVKREINPFGQSIGNNCDRTEYTYGGNQYHDYDFTGDGIKDSIEFDGEKLVSRIETLSNDIASYANTLSRSSSQMYEFQFNELVESFKNWIDKKLNHLTEYGEYDTNYCDGREARGYDDNNYFAKSIKHGRLVKKGDSLVYYPYRLLFADFNNDGMIDVLSCSYDKNLTPTDSEGRLYYMYAETMNLSSKTFLTSILKEKQINRENNGLKETYFDNSFNYFTHQEQGKLVYHNKSKITFQAPLKFEIKSTVVDHVKCNQESLLIDYNNDGYVDILNGRHLYLNDKEGSFKSVTKLSKKDVLEIFDLKFESYRWDDKVSFYSMPSSKTIFVGKTRADQTLDFNRKLVTKIYSRVTGNLFKKINYKYNYTLKDFTVSSIEKFNQNCFNERFSRRGKYYCPINKHVAEVNIFGESSKKIPFHNVFGLNRSVHFYDRDMERTDTKKIEVSNLLNTMSSFDNKIHPYMFAKLTAPDSVTIRESNGKKVAQYQNLYFNTDGKLIKKRKKMSIDDQMSYKNREVVLNSYKGGVLSKHEIHKYYEKDDGKYKKVEKLQYVLSQKRFLNLHKTSAKIRSDESSKLVAENYYTEAGCTKRKIINNVEYHIVTDSDCRPLQVYGPGGDNKISSYDSIGRVLSVSSSPNRYNYIWGNYIDLMPTLIKKYDSNKTLIHQNNLVWSNESVLLRSELVNNNRSFVDVLNNFFKQHECLPGFRGIVLLSGKDDIKDVVGFGNDGKAVIKGKCDATTMEFSPEKIFYNSMFVKKELNKSPEYLSIQKSSLEGDIDNRIGLKSESVISDFEHNRYDYDLYSYDALESHGELLQLESKDILYDLTFEDGRVSRIHSNDLSFTDTVVEKRNYHENSVSLQYLDYSINETNSFDFEKMVYRKGNDLFILDSSGRLVDTKSPGDSIVNNKQFYTQQNQVSAVNLTYKGSEVLNIINHYDWLGRISKITLENIGDTNYEYLDDKLSKVSIMGKKLEYEYNDLANGPLAGNISSVFPYFHADNVIDFHGKIVGQQVKFLESNSLNLQILFKQNVLSYKKMFFNNYFSAFGHFGNDFKAREPVFEDSCSDAIAKINLESYNSIFNSGYYSFGEKEWRVYSKNSAYMKNRDYVEYTGQRDGTGNVVKFNNYSFSYDNNKLYQVFLGDTLLVSNYYLANGRYFATCKEGHNPTTLENCVIKISDNQFLYEGHYLNYFHLGNELIGIIHRDLEGIVNFYPAITDHLGSLLGVIKNNVSSRSPIKHLFARQYDLWGNIKRHFVDSAKSKKLERLFHLGYAGNYIMPYIPEELTLYVSSTRSYSPQLKEWMSLDPMALMNIDSLLKNPLNLYLYQYAGNRPYNLVDPSGYAAMTLFYGASGNAGGLRVGGSGIYGRYHEVDISWGGIKVSSGDFGGYGGGYTLGAAISGGGTFGIMFGGHESLSGSSYEIGGSLALGIAGVGADLIVSGDLNSKISSGNNTFGFSITPSVGFGAEGHINIMDGWTSPDRSSSGSSSDYSGGALNPDNYSMGDFTF